MGNLSTFLVALSFLCSSQALQKVTVYNSGSSSITGKDSVTVHRNQPNLTAIDIVLGNIGYQLYACYTGRWTFCDGSDYTTETRKCIPKVSPENEEECSVVTQAYDHESFRHVGPSDLGVKSIAVYTDESFGGTETILQEGQEYLSGITTPTLSFATSGYSNWTLYEGTNFDGFSRCLTSTQNLHEYPVADSTLRNIGSIAPGCVPCVPQTIVMYPNHVEKLVG